MRLTRAFRRTLNAIGAGLWLTGVLWLVFHYFLMRQTLFGPAPSPWEPRWLSLHGLFAFLSLWMFGWLWGRHVIGGWKAGRHRLTGGTLVAVVVVLVVSGYLLYYPPNDRALSIIAIVHWSIGLALVIPFLLHRSLRPSGKPRKCLDGQCSASWREKRGTAPPRNA